jgi:predicted NUDIX family NTP pyrophosphohydrolase
MVNVAPILIAMPKRSAGLLMFRRKKNGVEVFLVHPGGPFWSGKDAGAWTVPKGEYVDGEEPLDAARREFHEETGFESKREFLDLGTVKQASGKVVSAWAFEGDCDPSELTSNLCTVEWPPRSGRTLEIPEVDRGAWFTLPAARMAILKSQALFLDVLARLLRPIDNSIEI